jgi:lysophospholipase L1-like esterase
MRVRHHHRLAVGAAVAAVLAGALALPPAGAAAGCGPRGTACKWLASWAAAPMAAAPASLAAPDDVSAAGFHGQTIRDIIWTSAGGKAARIRLSNQFGTRPVTFSQVDVGISAGGPLIDIGTDHRATFAGRTSVTIAPGAFAVSDPVAMTVPAQTDLAVSLYASGTTGAATYHSDAQQVSYVSGPGDYAGSESAAAFIFPSQHWYFLTEVDVLASAATGGTVVAFGDSITDGYRSAVGANGRWPNDLARRLLAGPPGQAHPVVDEGISGNRILASSDLFGLSARARFLRDTAALSGARYVILLEGINDIQSTLTSAAAVISGYRDLIAAAHAAGLKIFGATLTPFQGSVYYSAAAEADREAVNRWIRTSGAFDGVVDFDQAVRDPADPLRLLPAYDSGDHLHPDETGYQAMADAVTLAGNASRDRVRAGFAGGWSISLTMMSGPEVSTTWTRCGSRVRNPRKLRAP